MASQSKSQPQSSRSARKNKRVRPILRIARICLKKIFSWICNNKLISAMILIVCVFAVLIFCLIIPIFSNNFEGNVIAEEMTFIYNGKQQESLIRNINNIGKIENEGEQVITFTGKFQSQSLPEIERLQSLSIRLPKNSSKWMISPAISTKDSEIVLETLGIQPNTTLNNLNYDFYRKQLSFSLSGTSEQSNTLKIGLGIEPVKISFTEYEILNPNLPKINTNETLEFILTPDNSEFEITLPQKTTFYISLLKKTNFDKEQWFKTNIATKKVQFTRIEKNFDIRDDVEISKIVEGKIRMVEQEREIKANQFLMGEDIDKPLNIERIRHLQIIPDKGIEARFSGRSKQIQIGLDRNFPVSRIDGGWLYRVFSRDVITIFISFASAIFVSFLTIIFTLLVNNYSNQKGNP